jgi:hypothetical protein
MPKSKQRKNHKKKVQKYKNQRKAAEKQARKILMDEYIKKQEKLAKDVKAQKAGADVENSDIDIDLEIDDLDDINVDVDNVSVDEDEK